MQKSPCGTSRGIISAEVGPRSSTRECAIGPIGSVAVVVLICWFCWLCWFCWFGSGIQPPGYARQQQRNGRSQNSPNRCRSNRSTWVKT